MQKSAFTLLLVLFCSVLCNSAQESQVAILKLIGNRVMYIDGESEYNASEAVQKKQKSLEESDSVELLPGRHTIRFAAFDPNRGKTFQDHLLRGMNVEQVAEVQAGKTYTALWRSQATGRVSGPLGRTVEREYWVDITELHDNPGAYLNEYEVAIQKNDRGVALSALENYLALFPKDPRHKEMDQVARKLATAIDKSQTDAYRVENGGPRAKATETTSSAADASTSVIRTCKSDRGLAQLEEKPATPISIPGSAGAKASTELAQVLERASHYVEDYEAALGSLIGEEVYLQNPTRFATRRFPSGGRASQRTESDFAILKLGTDWVGLREVRCVDGTPVKTRTENLRKLADASPSEARHALDDLLQNDTHYNIGAVRRNTNLPTFALRILRRQNISRFKFDKVEETMIGGVRAWAVRFEEIRGPTLIHDGNRNEEFAKGTVWIEPKTGQVLKTEVDDSGGQGYDVFHAQAVVAYKYNSKLSLLVPINMVEHYDVNGSRVLDCRADYFDFHRFEVQTRFSFGAPIP